MVRFIVLYKHPLDPAAFEQYYAGTHHPQATRIPRLVRLEASRCLPAADGSPPEYYRVGELWFESMADLQAALASPEGQAVAADLPTFATGGATFLISEVTQVHGKDL